jgi:hypothetical protein
MLIAALLLSLSGTVGQTVDVPTASEVSAPAETPTIEDAPGLVSNIIQAAREKNWQLMVALIVMLLVALANGLVLKFVDEDWRKKLLPWFAVGTSCLVLFASTLIAGGSWWSAILAGFVTGAAAVGLWELIGKALAGALAKK